MGGKLITVSGGQFGSEAKGAVAAHLSKQEAEAETPLLAVRVGGPNAGHTVIGTGPDGSENFPWRLRSVPVAAVTNPEAALAIAAGSEVDEGVLHQELKALDAAGYQATNRLLIDSQATLLEHHHIEEEVASGLQQRLGSTAKGIGAARVDRIWRTATLYGGGTDVAAMARNYLRNGYTVLIEGTQGYGLGLHAGEYPYCTSNDCRAIDFMAMAGISPWDEGIDQLENWLVFRTRPIRVAGNSGPLKDERTWDGLGLPKEHTTVTKKERRVGEWDAELAQRAVDANGGPSRVRIALMMVDQILSQVAGVDTDTLLMGLDSGQATEIFGLAEQVADEIAPYEKDLGAPALLLGTSPSTMIDRRLLGDKL